MNLELENKIVVITGATGGIGRQIVLDFLQEGATVFCLFRNNKKFDDLENWISEKCSSSDKLFGISCDLLNLNQINAAIKEIMASKNRLDVLVNCAGTVEEVPFAMNDEKTINKMLDVNLKSAMMVSQAVLKPMFSQKQGAIVNISSVVATKAGRGIVAYATAKAGLESFTRSLALEVGRKNIRVNCVKPGAISTDMSIKLKDRASEYVLELTSLGRFGNPQDVSKAVLFLSSESASSFITGTSISVDGGYQL